MNHRNKDRQNGKKKKSAYKLKRSFTRNKKLRQDDPEGFRRKHESADSARTKKYSGGHFDKDKRDSNKEKRSERKELFAKKGKKDFTARKFGKEGLSKEGSFSKEKPYGKDRLFSKEKKREGGGDWKERKKEYYESKGRKPFNKKSDDTPAKKTYAEQGLIRLNRYIANAGICSRREADDLIATGCVTVNGKIITELGYKVKETDVVNYSGETLKTEKHRYVLLNKPKDYITTSEDERGRRTVMELIEDACKERVYPVGRLDRNTMGLLLFTNDGEMAKKLTHPKHRVQKLYHVELDKNLKHDDLLKIQEGVELEDGFIKPDEIAYAGETKREVGIMIHSGRNRIVRRIFEQLGYDVVRLDRVMFAGLTKKDLPRGRWRHLTEKEIAFLKMLN